MEKMEKIHRYEKQEFEKSLTKAKFELKCVEEKLMVIFTKGQIKKLKYGLKRQKWSEDDITHSITLYAVSPKMYKFLYRNHFPLPSVRTLQSWSQKLQMTRGLIKPVFKILQASQQMTTIQKLCVLSFDEMKIRSSYCYDRETDATLAPVNYVQVCMLRGLMCKWKQPIYYEFDCPMTKEIINSILYEVSKCGFTVAAIVSDLGGTNRSLINELEVTEEKPWFICNNQKIFYFADVPHLIKLLRNHFIDKGFTIDGKHVKKDIIYKLLEQTSGELSITHKISVANLTVTGAKRQKVKTATKLFSHTVAQAITRAASLGHLEGTNWLECHKLFKTTNDWFDIMNVRVPKKDARTRCHGYGLSLEEQNNILDQMSTLIREMRVIDKQNLLPFQKGILQSNNALKGLFNELKTRYNIKYIITYNLNQDILENFFGIIRAKGGLHDHPDQQEFKYRLRSYLLGRNSGVISSASNVEVDDTPDLETSSKSLTGIMFAKMKINDDTAQPEEDEFEDLKYDGLQNFAGYICHKLKDTVPNIAEPTETEPSLYTWVDHLSEDGLCKPTEEMMEIMKALDAIFSKINEEKLLITNDFLKIHLHHSQHINCSDKIKKIFFRARMYFKIKSLNNQLNISGKSEARKWHKILN